MKEELAQLLVCPSCLPLEQDLRCLVHEKDGADILAGKLQCPRCGRSYPIQEGTATLLPMPEGAPARRTSRYETPPLLYSYLWAHYGDILEDKDATTAYREWAALLDPCSGISLDAGCAVGRFTFEMGLKSSLSVGIDSSLPFVRTARELMKKGLLDFSMPVEGLLTERRTIRLPRKFQEASVEFVVADAQRIPFRKGAFSIASSLNMVDKLPLPLIHMEEINRVAAESRAQILFSDPFSWSPEVAREKDWLGGTTDGPYRGRGIDNIISLLTGERGIMSPSCHVERDGHVWWRIRTHGNHFELIRSLFIKAKR